MTSQNVSRPAKRCLDENRGSGFWGLLGAQHHLYCVLSYVLSCPVVSNSFATPWTVACQAPPSMGFSRQEYCSRLPSPTPGDLPDPRIEPSSLASPVFIRQILCHWATWEAPPYSRCLISDVFVTLGVSHFTKPSKLSVGERWLMFLPRYPGSIQRNLFSCLGVGVKPGQNFVCKDVNPFHQLPWQLRSAVADWGRAPSRLRKAQTRVHIGA